MSSAAHNLFLVFLQCIMLSVGYAESKRREEELAARTDFYHRMAHDLLTPLTVVSTNVQVVEKHPEEAGELMRDSQEEIMRMAAMINKALNEGGGGG
jgi:signal transduction histidine kinase